MPRRLEHDCEIDEADNVVARDLDVAISGWHVPTHVRRLVQEPMRAVHREDAHLLQDLSVVCTMAL